MKPVDLSRTCRCDACPACERYQNASFFCDWCGATQEEVAVAAGEAGIKTDAICCEMIIEDRAPTTTMVKL